MILTLALACTDNQLNVAQPDPVVDPAEIDFGEVVVNSTSTITVAVKNEGTGHLEISGVSLSSDTSADFSIVSSPEGTYTPSEEAELTVRYTPDVEGGDIGTVVLETNAEDKATVEIPLNGMGVDPQIDLDPETLNFGMVDAGSSKTLTVNVKAAGTGELTVSDVFFPGDEGAVYTLEMVSDWVTPYGIPSGASIPVNVTFTPPDDSPYEGEVDITSNDYEQPLAIVKLLGNVEDDPGTDTPPEVEVLTPDNGDYFLDNETVSFNGSVYDADEDATMLLCGWYANASKIANATVTSDGKATGSGLLPIGTVDLSLRCVDSTGLSGEDSARVDVWDHLQPMDYVISGGPSIYDYWDVDDDVTIYVNGVPVFTDTNHTSDSQAPVQFEASIGDIIEIVATDQNYSKKQLDPLTLHWGSTDMQSLNDAICEASDPDETCYTGEYSGPWPNIFYDETFTINIP